MPDSETVLDATVLDDDSASSEDVRELPVEVTAEVILATDPDAADSEPTDSQPSLALAIRHVLEHQLVAGNAIGTQLVDALTDVSAELVHTPAAVVDEIRGGATLPTALARTGTSLRGVVYDAGGRLRTAVGGYVGEQAALPNAVAVGTADVAEAIVRAQGTVTTSALNAAFALAATATKGVDVRDAFGRERDEVGAAVDDARNRVGAALRRAQDEVGAAMKDYGVSEADSFVADED